jgi:tripartite-type tricarboxylate transporter receptor subunit TctC
MPRLRAAKSILALAIGAAAVGATAQTVKAQAWPSRPIELIVPWTAGGAVDIVARGMAQAMSDQLGQNVFVSNRDGAAGTLGFRQVAASPPDGYTLGGGPATPITNAPYLVKGVRYDADSFEYICQYFENVFALVVNAGAKYKTAAEFIAAAASSPVKLNYGSPGMGSIGHLSAETMAEALKLNVQHVPFRGDAAALPVLLKGDLDFGVLAVASLRDQNVRVLAVFSDRRQASLPDVPTIKELGDTTPMVQGLNGNFAPKGLPANERETLERACAAAVRTETVNRTTINAGQVIDYLTGPQFRERVVSDYKFKGELIKRLGLESQ